MVGERTQVLARPWFFVAVALLFLNDHVFKQAWPGLVTGKLSDVAGVVVVATVASVLFGASWGTALAGLGFVALKTVPGVAEALAPLMGGAPTLRDASDLVALLALPPLWFVLQHRRPDQLSRDRRGWAAVGLVAAVLATTATSAAVRPWVDVRFSDNAFYAEVVRGYGGRTPFRSDDGGRTWLRMADIEPGSSPEPEASWAPEQCATDGTCYRVNRVSTPHEVGTTMVVERRVSGGEWVIDYRMPADTQGGRLAVNPSSSGEAVTSFDENVVRRTPDGSWESANLVDAADGEEAISTAVVADTPKWRYDLVEALNSPLTPSVVLLVLTVLIWWLVPWLAARLVLQVICVLVAAILSFFGGSRAVESYLWTNGVWAAVTLGLVGLMRFTWWREQRPRPSSPPGSAPAEDLR
ncbi:MAG: hypothetical protein LCH96_18120 [Actinobacteria bacterium]|nr:hypothetical protein [Actinomycetota bacterium]